MTNKYNHIFTETPIMGCIRLDSKMNIIYISQCILEMLDIKQSTFDVGSENKSPINISALYCCAFIKDLCENAVILGVSKKVFTDEKNSLWLVECNKAADGYELIYCNIDSFADRENELEEETERYRSLIDLLECGIWEYNPYTRTVVQYKKLKGRFNESRLVIKNFREKMLNWNCIHPEDVPIFNKFCDSMDSGEAKFAYELRTIDDNDEYIWVSYSGKSIFDKNGKLIKVIGKTADIDDEKSKIDSIKRHQEYDFNTDVFNAQAAVKRIEHAISSYGGEMHALFLIDVDNYFEICNDFGKICGQEILEDFAAKLKKYYWDTGVVGRYSEDRFIVFLKRISDYEIIVQAAKNIVKIMRDEAITKNKQFQLSASVGVSVIAQRDPRRTVKDEYSRLLIQADKALYYVKNTGKNNYEIYRSDMDYSQYSPTVRIVETNDVNPKDSPVYASFYTDKRITNFAFQVVNNFKNVDDAISVIFAEIGKYYNIPRISLFENVEQKHAVNVKYEWHNDSITTQSDFVDNAEIVSWEQYIQRFSDNGIYVCPNVFKTNITEEQKKLYEKVKTTSLLQCALFDGDKFYGCLNFDDRKERLWSQQEIATLSAVTRVIGIYMLQLHDKERLNDELFYNQAMLNNQKLSNYAVKKNTYELLYISEYTEKEFSNATIGKPCYKTLYGKDKPCSSCPIQDMSKYDKSYSVESYDKSKDCWYSTTVTSVSAGGRDDMYLICKSDVTNFMDRIQTFDSLTGIFTSQKFDAEVSKQLAQDADTRYAMVVSDIDGFKFINDEWGYTVGNDVLKVYAAECSTMIEEGEFCCRDKADNFRFLLKFTSVDDLRKRLNDMWKMVSDCLSKTYLNMNLSFVAGVCCFENNCASVSKMCDHANIARKSDKGLAKNTINFYDDRLNSQIKKEKEIEHLMRGALVNKEFVVYYQPKIDLKTKQITAAEALVRWRKSDGRLIPPNEFIPLFERNGFIEELDFYVYDEVFKKIKEWMTLHNKEMVISVNVSRVHIFDSMFIERLCKLIDKYQIPTYLIELEITENIVISNVERLIYMVAQLHAKGFLISIDDFGSGYSSLNILKRLPIDILKLDKEFFLQNPMDDRDRIVISSILQLAKRLDIKAISEGVETFEQEIFLEENGCDMVQGFLFHKPMMVEDFEKLILD